LLYIRFGIERNHLFNLIVQGDEGMMGEMGPSGSTGHPVSIDHLLYTFSIKLYQNMT